MCNKDGGYEREHGVKVGPPTSNGNNDSNAPLGVDYLPMDTLNETEWEIMNLVFVSLPDTVITAHSLLIPISAAIFFSSPLFPTSGSAAWSSILLDDPVSTVEWPLTPPAVFSAFH